MGGADKAMLQIDGQALVDIAAARLAPQVARLALSANGDPARFAPRPWPVLPDAERHGPLSGVLAGLLWAAPLGADWVVSLPVDAPFCPPDLVARLSAPGTAAWAETPARAHWASALWPVSAAAALGAFLAPGHPPRVRAFLSALGAVPVTFPDEAAFANINTPDDLAAASRGRR